MTTRIKNCLFVIIALLGIVFLPLLGQYLSPEGIPNGFFRYPMIEEIPKPGFNLWIFVAMLVVCIALTLIYIYPRIYGFKKYIPDDKEEGNTLNLPFWFYIGAALFLACAIVLWGKLGKPDIIQKYGYIGVIWGIVFMVDGLVFVRHQGKSLVKNHFWKFWAIALSSVVGWAIFAYMSFFSDKNWYYPAANLISQKAFWIYAFVGAGSMVPLCFELYMLMMTSDKLRVLLKDGPKISISHSLKLGVLLFTIASFILIPFFPNYLFPFLWVSPMLMLAITFSLLGLWSPFAPLKEGNWTVLCFMAMAEFISGFIYEGTNYLSAYHNVSNGLNPGERAAKVFTEVPGYWEYSIPYVDIWHFGEMPIEGMYGYMFYGVFNLLFWIACAYLVKIPFEVEAKEMFKE